MPPENPIEPVSILDRQKQKFPASNVPYVVATTIMVVLTLVAIVTVTLLRPDKDNTALIGTIIGSTMPATLALLAFMKTQETHLAVNSRLEDFMEAAKAIARQQGLKAGIAEEQRIQEERRQYAISARISDNKIESELRDARGPVIDHPSVAEEARRKDVEHRLADQEARNVVDDKRRQARTETAASAPVHGDMGIKVEDAAAKAAETVKKIEVVKEAVADLDKK